MPFQEDLDQMAESWNCHRMRPNRRSDQLGGRPVLLYTLPELRGLHDQMVAVDMDKVAECQMETIPKSWCPCADPEMFDLACIIIDENDWQCPRNGYEAALLYVKLRRVIRGGLGLG